MIEKHKQRTYSQRKAHRQTLQKTYGYRKQGNDGVANSFEFDKGSFQAKSKRNRIKNARRIRDKEDDKSKKP